MLSIKALSLGLVLLTLFEHLVIGSTTCSSTHIEAMLDDVLKIEGWEPETGVSANYLHRWTMKAAQGTQSGTNSRDHSNKAKRGRQAESHSWSLKWLLEDIEPGSSSCLDDPSFSIVIEKGKKVKKWIDKVVEAIGEPLGSFVERNDIDNRNDDNEQNVWKAIVVGAGPVGLMSSIGIVEGLPSSLKSTAEITIYEKRTSWTRNIWFDVSSPPFGDAMPALKSWGIEFLNADWYKDVHSDSTGTRTIRCQILERFLAKVATALGVQWERGVAFEEDQGLPKGFDLVIGADGPNSVIRSAAGLGSYVAESFTDIAGNKRSLEGLHQPNMILELECREVAQDPKTGNDVMPWDIGSKYKEVPLVFKRFFGDHCSLQFLFTLEYGDGLIESGQVDWNRLLEFTNELVEVEFRDVEELKSSLHRDPLLFPVVIRGALDFGRVTADGAAVIVVGDAELTAHYRLGIGVNKAFVARKDLVKLVGQITSNGRDPEEAVAEYVARRRVDVEKVRDFQLNVMWMETYCGLIVFFDTEQNIVVTRRSDLNRRLEPEEVMSVCSRAARRRHALNSR